VNEKKRVLLEARREGGELAKEKGVFPVVQGGKRARWNGDQREVQG